MSRMSHAGLHERGEYRGQLRLPTPLAARVKSMAARERRSMNSQIIVLLERALPTENEKAEAAATAPAE